MPDLTFQVEGVEADAACGRAAVEFQAADHERRSGGIDSERRLALPDANRSARAAAIRPKTGPAARFVRRAGPLEPHAAHDAVDARERVVPPFSGETIVDLPVPCTFDFNVAATKYFTASQTARCRWRCYSAARFSIATPEGGLQVDANPLGQRGAAIRCRSRIWQEMMDVYYPNGAWLRLRRDVFERLYDIQSAARDSDLGADDRTIA